MCQACGSGCPRASARFERLGVGGLSHAPWGCDGTGEGANWVCSAVFFVSVLFLPPFVPDFAQIDAHRFDENMPVAPVSIVAPPSSVPPDPRGLFSCSTFLFVRNSLWRVNRVSQLRRQEAHLMLPFSWRFRKTLHSSARQGGSWILRKLVFAIICSSTPHPRYIRVGACFLCERAFAKLTCSADTKNHNP